MLVLLSFFFRVVFLILSAAFIFLVFVYLRSSYIVLDFIYFARLCLFVTWFLFLIVRRSLSRSYASSEFVSFYLIFDFCIISLFLSVFDCLFSLLAPLLIFLIYA